RTFMVKPVGFKDTLHVTVDFACECNCKQSSMPASPSCHYGNGTLECGVCLAPRANTIPPNKTDVALTQRRRFVAGVETVCADSVPVARLILGRFGGRSVNVMTLAASVSKDKYVQ
ncbi:hypothetical protein M9458_006616, partial [Cirrhinus mrigala]